MKWSLLFIALIGLTVAYWAYYKNNEFVLPKGDTVPLVVNTEKEDNSILKSNDSLGEVNKPE